MDTTDINLKRYRNLKMFRGKTDEEIMTYLNNRPLKPINAEPKPVKVKPSIQNSETDYDKLFKTKLKILQKEYGVDMNDANDADSLRSLVRFMMQLEEIDKRIREFYDSGSANSKALKDLGDYQRSVQTSIGDLQRGLGISRQVRQEKQVEDIPKYIENLQDRAKAFWEANTTSIRCENDEVLLFQYWLNFPKLHNEISVELECWKCKTKVIYNYGA